MTLFEKRAVAARDMGQVKTAGGDLGVPGLTISELPDMAPAPLWKFAGNE